MTDTPTRTLLRYFGGKWCLAPWIISYFPDHRIYVEPFGGGASVLLRKRRSYAEVYNDLDGEIVNLFRVLRESGPELIERLYLTPFAREELTEAYKESVDPIERARQTIIKSFLGFGADSIFRRSGFRADCKRSGTTPAADWGNYPDQLRSIIKRLRTVVIENRDALEVISTHDGPETLFYLDPPYHPDTRKWGVYSFEAGEEEHWQLIDAIKNISGMAVISGYEHELYNQELSGWRKVCFKTYSGHPDKTGHRERKEVIYLSPNVPQKQLELFVETGKAE